MNFQFTTRSIKSASKPAKRLYAHKHGRLKRRRADVDSKPSLLCINIGATFLRGSCASGKVERILYNLIFSDEVTIYLPVFFPQSPLFSQSHADLITVGQGPIALAVGAGGGGLDIFTLIYLFSYFSLSLGDGPI